MATEKDVNEPIPKLTTKLRSEMPLEPFEYTVSKPAEPIIKNNKENTTWPEQKTSTASEDEERFEESTENVETPKTLEHKPQRRQQIASKSKGIGKSLPTSDEASL